MKIKKLYDEILKHLMSDKKLLICCVIEGKVWISVDWYKAYAIPEEMFVFDRSKIALSGEPGKNIIEKMIKDAHGYKKAELTPEVKQTQTNHSKKPFTVREIKTSDGKNHAWVQEAYLKYFNHPQGLYFKISGPKSPILVYLYNPKKNINVTPDAVIMPVFVKE